METATRPINCLETVLEPISHLETVLGPISCFFPKICQGCLANQNQENKMYLKHCYTDLISSRTFLVYLMNKPRTLCHSVGFILYQVIFSHITSFVERGKK
jgi:hypothetical protein